MRLALALILGLATTAAQADPRFARDWPQTDFSKASIDLQDVISGGPPKDGIPAIDAPRHIPVAQETRLADREGVLSLTLNGDTRAWPIRYLMWHEIVNDTLGGVPIAVTYCPLCNTGLVFDRRHGGRVLDFGVSGLLRHSDMIMHDRQTESWWQQALGQAVAGALTGAELEALPARMEGWGTFRARHPDASVLDQPEANRPFGRNPYVGYDLADRPFLYDGADPPHGIHPLARVVRVGNRAWPLDRLIAARRLDSAGLVLTWEEGQASALERGDLGQGREVGNVRVTDAQGRDVVHDIPFAFAFHAFHPGGVWMLD